MLLVDRRSWNCVALVTLNLPFRTRQLCRTFEPPNNPISALCCAFIKRLSTIEKTNKTVNATAFFVYRPLHHLHLFFFLVVSLTSLVFLASFPRRSLSLSPFLFPASFYTGQVLGMGDGGDIRDLGNNITTAVQNQLLVADVKKL